MTCSLCSGECDKKDMYCGYCGTPRYTPGETHLIRNILLGLSGFFLVFLRLLSNLTNTTPDQARSNILYAEKNLADAEEAYLKKPSDVSVATLTRAKKKLAEARWASSRKSG
jgi:hypothetical protein